LVLYSVVKNVKTIISIKENASIIIYNMLGKSPLAEIGRLKGAEPSKSPSSPSFISFVGSKPPPLTLMLIMLALLKF